MVMLGENRPKFDVCDPDRIPVPYAEGNGLVVPRDAILPRRCVKCANTATEPWLQKTFSWHHPALYFLLLLGLFPYAIVAAIIRKKIKLAVPLCDAHKSIRKKRLWTGALLLFTCIPVPWVLASYTIKDAGVAFCIAALLGAGMFVAGVMFTVCESPLRATHIGLDSAKFKGACPDFLASLRAAPNVKAEVRAAGM
jgi:hypothetical protein